MCQLPVRGLVAWCQGCGHGGHAEHLHAWFQTNLECPTGCGHRCQIRYAAPVGRAVAQPLVPDPDGATARLAELCHDARMPPPSRTSLLRCVPCEP